MSIQRTKTTIYGRFDEGEDLHDAYQRVMRDEDVTAGVVLSGIGMLEDPELGYFVGDGAYDREVLEGRYELLSTQGNLSLHEGEPFTHLHVVLGTPDHGSVGGHLFAGDVAVAHEFALQVLPDGSLERRDDPSTGLLSLCPV